MASVDDIFGAIGAALEQTPSLAAQVNGNVVFDFGGAEQWTLYLKAPHVGVKKERTPNADVTLSLTPEDFMQLAGKKLSAQQLFIKGRLRLKGNLGLAMKLGKVLDAAAASPPAAAAAAPAAAPSTAPALAPSPAAPSHKSAPVFEAIGAALKRDGAALVAKTKGVFRFVIAGVVPGPTTHTYTLDLKNGSGRLVGPGGTYDGPAPDLELHVSDDDFVALAHGKLNAQQAFMKGRIKLKGSIPLAMKLASVLAAAREPPPPSAKL